MNEPSLTVHDLAREFQVHWQTIARWARHGDLARWGIRELPRVPRGHRRFSAASVERALGYSAIPFKSKAAS